MSLFGYIKKEKYEELQDVNRKLRESLNDSLDGSKKLRNRISELSTSLENVSTLNKQLRDRFHTAVKERDQLQTKLEKYVEERQVMQKLISELDSLARKRRKKSDEPNLEIETFDSDIKKLLDKPSV
jgi:chromosome segregation ATPase